MDSSTREAKNFRRQLRLPFQFYTTPVEKCKRKRWFRRAGRTGAVGRQAIPILAVLQILGRGTCFDDIEIASGIAESTIQALFHTSCKNCAKVMYETWIFTPVGDDLKKVTDTFGKLGFPGAVGPLM
ncbi:unnamed protein product [Discosporangium mesarthrocarpum]